MKFLLRLVISVAITVYAAQSISSALFGNGYAYLFCYLSFCFLLSAPILRTLKFAFSDTIHVTFDPKFKEENDKLIAKIEEMGKK